MTLRPALAFFALATAIASARAEEARPVAEPCPGRMAESVIRAVSDDGEVALADGGRIKLVDIRLAPEGPGVAWLRSMGAAVIGVTILGEPDRWERSAARAATAGVAPVDLAEFLVGEGWAVVDAGSRDRLCRPDLLGIEAAARRRHIGLWGDPGSVMQAGDAAVLAEAAGRFVVVEGRVVSVGERRAWTYLNFGRDFGRDFSVSIPRRIWTNLAARGVTAATLVRRNVRVRGTIEIRRAPGIEIVVPEMLERLE